MKGTIINQVKYTEYQTGDKEPTLKDAQIPFGFTQREVITKEQEGGYQKVGQRGL